MRKGKGRLCEETGEEVVGIAVCIKDMEVFYLNLLHEDNQESAEKNSSLCEPKVDESIVLNRKLSFIRWLMNSNLTGTAISWRLQASLLYTLSGTIFKGAEL